MLYRYNCHMSKASRSTKAIPSIVTTQLQKLGHNIALARKRRRFSMKNMAERMLVSLETIQRLERGDPAVSIGIIATALWVLGVHQRLGNLITPESDNIGLQTELKRLPRDFRKTKKTTDDYDF